MTLTGSRIYLACVFAGVFLISLTGPLKASKTEFRSQLKSFFHSTQTLHAVAQTTRVKDESDSFTAEFAYKYPDQFLQWIRYEDNREQIIIHNDERVLLAYPHLDVVRKGNVKEEEFRRQLSSQVPVLGLILALGSDKQWPEEVEVKRRNSTYEIRADLSQWPRVRGAVELRVNRDPFRPEWMKWSTSRTLEMETREWTVNSHLPENIQWALHDMDPSRLQGTESDE